MHKYILIKFFNLISFLFCPNSGNHVLASTMGSKISSERISFSEIIIDESKKNNDGLIDLKKFGDKVCISPDGLNFRTLALHSFPGILVTEPDVDMSEGVWYLGIQTRDSPKHVRIFAVSQDKITWRADESTPVKDVIACNVIVQIRMYNDKWIMSIP